jgi:uncharacterized protein (TIGR02270 family)
VRQAGIEATLADRESLVRARAARTIGELGRIDLRPKLNALLTDTDEDCRFWAAWSGARLGTEEGVRALAEFVRSPGPRCDRSLALLLRCLSTEHADGLLRRLASDPRRLRTVIWATAVIGNAFYIPWLMDQARDPKVARIAGEAFETITGADIASPDRAPEQEQHSGPNDNLDDEDVGPDADDGLSWPDTKKVEQWWTSNKGRFSVGTCYFLGTPRNSANWIGALAEAPQRRRLGVALDLAVLRPAQAIYNVRASGKLQQRLLQRAEVAS